MSATALSKLAHALVAHCRNRTEAEGLATLYHPDAVSVEAMAMPGSDSRETTGVAAIRGKHDWWNATFETLSDNVDGPFLHGDDRFAVIFEVETRNRETGETSAMKEVGVYHVAAGRIVREEFFYTM